MPTTYLSLPGPGECTSTSATCANNTCGAFLDPALPAGADGHFGSVHHFDTAAFRTALRSTDVYRTSVNIGKGRKKSFPVRRREFWFGRRDGRPSWQQRGFTVGGGWDCASNKATYAKITYATGMPLSKVRGRLLV